MDRRASRQSARKADREVDKHQDRLVDKRKDVMPLVAAFFVAFVKRLQDRSGKVGNSEAGVASATSSSAP